MTDTSLSPDLESARQALHAESSLWQPPAALEAQVLAQLPEQLPAQLLAQRPARSPARTQAWWQQSWLIGPALCASLTAFGFYVALWRDAPHDGQATVIERSTPFVALASAAEISAAQHPVIVERAMPRDQLPQYGFAFSPERVHEPVHAQWLVSERGQALAVRFSDEILLKE